ncbi:hypothetical protein GCM10010215_27070 [Streptomyces virginiae]|uniref:Secreted protein n=1 Tax=Streptomyces virginiae TaxID=1961 RepID=A0ABQ3NXU1_STRVG|nr:hypothetical protein GCM10010215_27070 [Streptomyces virginiae]GHI17590.1 hypothetical protein Scinn_70530 [Streptomyces virginiae]
MVVTVSVPRPLVAACATGAGTSAAAPPAASRAPNRSSDLRSTCGPAPGPSLGRCSLGTAVLSVHMGGMEGVQVRGARTNDARSGRRKARTSGRADERETRPDAL